MSFIKQYKIGRQIYRGTSFSDKKRATVFAIRSLKRKKLFEEFIAYCKEYKPYPNMLIEYIDVLDMMSRVFLYKNSTAEERLKAWKNHFNLMERFFKTEAIYNLYHDETGQKQEISSEGWLLYSNEDLDLRLRLVFCHGQRKEGFMTLLVEYQNEKLYNLNCRLDYDETGQRCIVIGTIQGKQNGLTDSKKLTKKMFGYRPKNLALYIVRIIAETLDIKKIMAVSDFGFYANSHLIRIHRSKTVYFDDFWKENGGVILPVDPRFFILPVREKRKTYETAKTHKRNLYRKRYELLDEIKECVQKNVIKIMV